MRKSEFEYLMRDIVIALSGRFEREFLYLAKHHSVVKETTRKIFVEEVAKKKPSFKVLNGTLILLSGLMNQYPSLAIYEVIDVIPQIKKCMTSKFKTIRGLARDIAFKMFVELYFEYVLMPGRREEDRKEYLDKFRNYFPLDHMLEIINSGVFWRFYFQYVGIEIKGGPNGNDQLKKIIEDFYGVTLQTKNAL